MNKTLLALFAGALIVLAGCGAEAEAEVAEVEAVRTTMEQPGQN